MQSLLACRVSCLCSEHLAPEARWDHGAPLRSPPQEVPGASGLEQLSQGESAGLFHLPCTCFPPSLSLIQKFSLLCCQAFSWKDFHDTSLFPTSPSLTLVPWTHVCIKPHEAFHCSVCFCSNTLYRCQKLPEFTQLVYFYWHLYLQIKNICIKDGWHSDQCSIDLRASQSILIRLFNFSHCPRAMQETFFPFIWLIPALFFCSLVVWKTCIAIQLCSTAVKMWCLLLLNVLCAFPF